MPRGLPQREEALQPTGLDSFQLSGKTASVTASGEHQLLLRSVGLRVTRPRLEVLAAVHDHPHSDTESIIRAARRGLPDVSHQAVYDVLRALSDAGLVRRIQPSGSSALYEARTGDNHHHAVCRSCGAVADVDCAVATAPCLTVSDDHGFAVDEAAVIYWGRCAACSPTTA